ncbi:hypothetical protein GGD56_006838 [Rhizobium mongolense]|uniref:Transposase-like protein DUF772 n=1 Tax=Rhizobium mongolense TaxID=57676 RepID=A0ABR6IZI3_9HYPH|nr:hypothetical protein [Rhizobium mongolense]
MVTSDLRRQGVAQTGRQGSPSEAVLRCALLKQYRQLSYEELAFHLEDFASFRAFARLPWGWSPKKSVLHKTFSVIRARAAQDRPEHLDYLQQAAAQLPLAGPAGKLWQAQVRHYQPLIAQIIAQTERRVLAADAMPAGEKLVSLFEPHADIIVKGSRDIDYGH